MTRESLSPDLKRFIFERIESVEQMEILLLLAADSSVGEWSADRIAKELRCSPRSVGRWLGNLESQKFLTTVSNSPVCYRYTPQADELRTRVMELAEAYSTRRVSVIELIFNKPAAKMQSLADAFKIREDK